jgi:hypothetical protein
MGKEEPFLDLSINASQAATPQVRGKGRLVLLASDTFPRVPPGARRLYNLCSAQILMIFTAYEG